MIDAENINLEIVEDGKVKVTGSDLDLKNFAIMLKMNDWANEATNSQQPLTHEYKGGELYLNGGGSFDLLKNTIEAGITKDGLKIVTNSIDEINHNRYKDDFDVMQQKASNEVQATSESSKIDLQGATLASSNAISVSSHANQNNVGQDQVRGR